MKNFKILFVFSLMLFAFNCFSQHHLKKWYISPNQIDVTQIPGVTGISGATVGTDELCNGMYDPYNLNGPPMFYIAHDPLVASPFFGLNVYDATNTSMGQLQGYISGRSPEIAIVPFPDNNGCANNRYYIFISSPGPSTNELEFQVVDMNGNGGLGTLSGPTTVISIPGSEWGGIAVGPQQGGTRYLYFCGGSTFVSTGRQIDKITINSSGVTAQNILTDFNNFFDFETSEMDINPKSTMLAFASNYAQLQSPPRYYVVGLNANGNWNGVITTFNVGTDNNPGGRGVEFYEETNGNVRLLVGAGNNGIYSVNPSNPTVGQMQIVGSANYGHSQLEAGYNNSIYASSSNDMAAIDITGTAPVIDPAYNISIPAPSTNLPGLFYNLLDQIDVENYDLLAGKHGDLDLYMKDFNSNANGHIDDVGNEPNPDNQEMWVSNDLWTRQNQGQGGGVQEDPEYWMDPLHNNWVYVVIRNRSCVDYAGGAELYLYWAKASTALAWPINWDGSLSMPCTDINGVPVNPKLGNALSPIPSKPIQIGRAHV